MSSESDIDEIEGEDEKPTIEVCENDLKIAQRNIF